MAVTAFRKAAQALTRSRRFSGSVTSRADSAAGTKRI